MKKSAKPENQRNQKIKKKTTENPGTSKH